MFRLFSLFVPTCSSMFRPFLLCSALFFYVPSFSSMFRPFLLCSALFFYVPTSFFFHVPICNSMFRSFSSMFRPFLLCSALFFYVPPSSSMFRSILFPPSLGCPVFSLCSIPSYLYPSSSSYTILSCSIFSALFQLHLFMSCSLFSDFFGSTFEFCFLLFL